MINKSQFMQIITAQDSRSNKNIVMKSDDGENNNKRMQQIRYKNWQNVNWKV